MQQVMSTKNLLPLFKDIEEVYRVTSEKTASEQFGADISFRELFRLFREYGGYHFPVRFEKRKYEPVTATNFDDHMVLCFSGGKDSVATALWYKEHGYKVMLYHLHGINQTYKDEWRTAKVMAEKLDLPITIELVYLKGPQSYTEHPMKNMIIANFALQWALDNGWGYNIAFGNYTTSSLKDDPFDVCSGDDQEMWRAYEKIIQRIIPDFQMHAVLRNLYESLDVMYQNFELVPHIQSCIGPFRYREYLHKNNCTKYNIELLPHRCGSCWKDSVEYIYFADRNKLPYNEEFYKHCLQILQRTLKKEENRILIDLYDVYRAYFPEGNSLYFKEVEE